MLKEAELSESEGGILFAQMTSSSEVGEGEDYSELTFVRGLVRLRHLFAAFSRMDAKKWICVPTLLILPMSLTESWPISRLALRVRPSILDWLFLGVISIGAAPARSFRQKRRIMATQYAVYPFRPRSDKGRSGVPGDALIGEVEGCRVR